MAAIPLNVLVAEDHDPTFKIFQIHTHKLNLSLVRARNGREAIERYAERPEWFDLILMDVEMPELDGVEATRRIRALEREHGWRRLPIIALTAHDEEEYIAKFNDCGMDSLLEKPYQPAVIASVVARHRKEKERRMAAGTRLEHKELRGAISNIKHQLWADLQSDCMRIIAVCDEEAPLADKTDRILRLAQRFRGFGGHLSHIFVVDTCARMQEAAMHNDLAEAKSLAASMIDYAQEQQHAQEIIRVRDSQAAAAALNATETAAMPELAAAPGSPVGARSLDDAQVPLDEDMRSVMMVFRSMYMSDLAESISRMRQAMSEDPYDFAVLRRLGHLLKGTGLSLGHQKVTDLGTRVNTAAIDKDKAQIDDLVVQLEQYMREAEAEEPPSVMPPSLPAVTPAIKPEGNLRNVGDEDTLAQFNRTVKASYVKSLPSHVDDLIAALERGSFAELLRIGQQLQMLGGRLGDNHIADIANRIVANAEVENAAGVDGAVQLLSSYLDHVAL